VTSQDQREDAEPWRLFKDILEWRDRQARDKLASTTSSERSRRLEKRQNPPTSPGKKKNPKRQAVTRKPPVRQQHQSRSPSVERPRRVSADLPPDDTTELEDLLPPDSPLDRELLQHTPRHEEGASFDDGRTDLDTSLGNQDDQFFDNADSSILSANEAEKDSMALDLLKNSKHYGPMMRLILEERRNYQSIKTGADKAKVRCAQAEASASTIASEAQDALELDAAPSEESLGRVRTDLMGVLQNNRDYNGHLEREIKEVNKFATLGVTSASRDLASLQASKASCEAEIAQLETRVAKMGAYIERMGVVVQEVEDSQENRRKAEKALLEFEDVRRMAEHYIGKPSSKLTTGLLEDIFEDHQD